MGYYISEGPNIGKAKYLIETYGAIECPFPPTRYSQVPKDKAIICVVLNASMGFDAAAYAFNDEELNRFQYRPDDQRPRRWLLMNRDKVRELTGFRE